MSCFCIFLVQVNLPYRPIKSFKICPIVPNLNVPNLNVPNLYHSHTIVFTPYCRYLYQLGT